jgi:DNA helicase HerA-like ATPase
MMQSVELACIFNPSGKTSAFKAIDEFVGDPSGKVLRISMRHVPFAHHARDILVNSVGRYVLGLARQRSFRAQPLVVFLDEAHQFLNKSLGDDFSRYPLDAFDLVAKEGRKYGLNVCLATQRPRDISEGLSSQVGTLIVHRLTNDRDREVVERASGEIDRSAAAFVPNLAPGEAVIIGVDFPFPITVTIHEPAQKPDSRGPDYQKAWAVKTTPGRATQISGIK